MNVISISSHLMRKRTTRYSHRQGTLRFREHAKRRLWTFFSSPPPCLVSRPLDEPSQAFRLSSQGRADEQYILVLDHAIMGFVGCSWWGVTLYLVALFSGASAGSSTPEAPFPGCLVRGFEQLGNGYCDGNLNHPACGYDGGDCCPCTCQESQGLYNTYSV